jgi:hypothetical protein
MSIGKTANLQCSPKFKVALKNSPASIPLAGLIK